MHSRFYPKERLRADLIELGIPEERHDMISLRSFLPPDFRPAKLALTEDVNDLAEIVIYLTRKKVIRPGI